MKIIAILIIFVVQEILALKTYYATPESYSGRNKTESTVTIPWTAIYDDPSRYFTSHTEIILKSGAYYLHK